MSPRKARALLPLFLAPGSEPFHAAWIERAAEVTGRRLEDDVARAFATGAFDPVVLPDLPEVDPWDPEDLDDPLKRPEGVQTGARPMARQETDVWVANVPANVARLFRACPCSVARRPPPDVLRRPGRAPGALVFAMPLGHDRSGDRAVSC